MTCLAYLLKASTTACLCCSEGLISKMLTYYLKRMCSSSVLVLMFHRMTWQPYSVVPAYRVLLSSDRVIVLISGLVLIIELSSFRNYCLYSFFLWLGVIINKLHPEKEIRLSFKSIRMLFLL